jgi:hypothetical protein
MPTAFKTERFQAAGNARALRLSGQRQFRRGLLADATPDLGNYRIF